MSEIECPNCMEKFTPPLKAKILVYCPNCHKCVDLRNPPDHLTNMIHVLDNAKKFDY